MALLKDKHASLRWRAAEVVATCAQNNLPVQEWLLKAGCLPKLIRLLEDPDTTCRSEQSTSGVCQEQQKEQFCMRSFKPIIWLGVI